MEYGSEAKSLQNPFTPSDVRPPEWEASSFISFPFSLDSFDTRKTGESYLRFLIKMIPDITVQEGGGLEND